jgi:hypothetical protein
MSDQILAAIITGAAAIVTGLIVFFKKDKKAKSLSENTSAGHQIFATGNAKQTININSGNESKIDKNEVKQISEQTLGGIHKIESIEDKAKRIKDEINEEKSRINFISSSEGVQSAKQEIVTPFETIDKKCRFIEKDVQFKFNIEQAPNTLDAVYGDLTLRIKWSQFYKDSTNKANLIMEIWNGKFISPHSDKPFLPWIKLKKLKSDTFTFNKNSHDDIGWQFSTKDEFIFTSELAEKAISMFLDEIHKSENK